MRTTLQINIVPFVSTEETHSSVNKAALIAGVEIRLLPTDDTFGLTGSTLQQAMEEDTRRGLIPFYVRQKSP